MSHGRTKDLTVVVTHYRTPELLAECLTRLQSFAPKAALIVCDSSPERDAQVLTEQAFPGIRLLSAANHSMANLVNVGLKAAQTPYILQMNADVMIAVNTLPAMLKECAQEGVGMVGPRCRTRDGRWQNQGPGYYLNYALLELTKRPSLCVPWLSGCCQMLKREVLDEVGGLDSSLRFYNEDMEWCWRIRKAGYACQLIKESVLHIGGASTPNDEKFLLEGFRGGYVLSQRYKPTLYRWGHRRVMQLYAKYKVRTANSPSERQSYQKVLEMFRSERFEESPFGTSLDKENPRFLAND